MIKNIVCSLLFLLSISLFSQQEKLNNYKYIIVPEKFDFVKSTDQYQTSSLTKFLLKKKGFNVFLGNEKLPEESMTNRCLALIANVVDESGMFRTKMYIEFRDCYNNVIYTTGVGKSKEKEYRKAYHEGIRNAYNSMSGFKYSYSALEVSKKTKKEVISESKTKKNALVVKTLPKVVVTPEIKKEVKKAVIKESKIKSNSIGVLYAQPKSNGFQLINTKPEVVFLILKTNKKDTYIIKDKNGVFYKLGDKWVAEYYKEEVLIQKEYQVKF